VEKKPIFKKIKEAFELYQLKSTSLTLDAFLIMPVQRIPRYVLLLKELLKYSNPSHPDYALLEGAFNKVKAILEELNKGIDEEAHVRVQKIISIEDSVDGLIGHLPDGLYHPQRRLLREGLLNLRIMHRGTRPRESLRAFQKQFYFFAFNDLILCCGRKDPAAAATKGGNQGTHSPKLKADTEQQTGLGSAASWVATAQFKYASSITLSEIESVGDGMAPDQHDAETLQTKFMHIQHAFHVITPHVGWTLVCNSDQEKQSWLSVIRNVVDSRTKEKPVV